jgi:hypothetical protein
LTTEGSLLGTPDYLAPEQARNAHQADIRADIYSCGCMLFHLLTGQTPFPDANILSQIVKHATEPAPPLSKFLGQVPPGLQEVVNWMMAKDPNQRYPTPARAAQALLPFLPPMADAAPGTAPLPSYMQYLHSGLNTGSAKAASVPPPKAESTKANAYKAPPPPKPIVEPLAPAAAPQIPIGRIETDSKRKKDPTAARAKLAAPAPAAPASTNDEYDVEIIGPVPPPVIEPLRPIVEDNRGLFDLNRRDWIMLGIGSGVMGSALLLGFGLSRLLRKKPEPTVPEEKPIDATPPPKKTPAKPEDKKEEPKTSEPKKEEPKTDEMKKEEMKKEEMKKEEMNKE